MMRLLLVSLMAALTACVGHYRYESAGTVQSAGDTEQRALLYWYADDGRLWFGSSYKQVDTTVGFLVCGSPPKNFDGGEADEPLVLRSRSGDRQVLTEDDQGQLVEVASPNHLPVGSACGYISMGGQRVGSAELVEGSAPTLSILCDNETRPERYPLEGVYVFAEVSRTRITKDDGRGAPDDFCESRE